jgi:putative transposase
MARARRIQVAGGLYHLTTRAKTALFRSDEDRRFFLSRFQEVVARRLWTCHTYCLMTTHYHLLVMTPEPDLAAGMQRLNGDYASYFNDRYSEWGHVFAARYSSTLIQGDGHLLELVRYIALNPVRAGICRNPATWRWSSYPAALGVARPLPFLSLDYVQALFGKDLEQVRGRLRSFVEG